MRIKLKAIDDEHLAMLVAKMLENVTGQPCRAVKWIRGSKFKIERFTGSKWVKG